MGAHLSRRIRSSEIKLDNVVDNTNKMLGDLDIFETIDLNTNIDTIDDLEELKRIVKKLRRLFPVAYEKSMKKYDKHIKLNNLQFNYKEKNKVIIQDLKNKLRLQNTEIKESSEDNYKLIREIQITNNKYKEEETTQKYLVVILVIIILIILGILGLFAKRKLDSGAFFIN